MSVTEQNQRESIIDAVAEELRRELPEPESRQAAGLARCLYRRVPEEELAASPTGQLSGLVGSLLAFARRRLPGTPLVRIFNPTEAEHGWASTHTVVEIVNDDMPFLVDSVSMAIARQEISVHLILHPLLRVERDDDGIIRDVHQDTGTDDGGRIESVLHFEIDRQTEKRVLDRLRRDIERALGDVRAVVADWQPMRDRALALCDRLEELGKPVKKERIEEAGEFLKWVAGEHFTFLGYREYHVVSEDGDEVLEADTSTGLGLLKHREKSTSQRSIRELAKQAEELEREPESVIVTKTNARATVHRPGYMDYIGVLHYGNDGRVLGEHRFIGLFTSGAYTRRPWDVPLVRRKVEAVMERSTLRRHSHAGKALAHILDTLPRDELFQASESELFDLATGILNLQERLRTRLFIRRDRFGRFFSCLVFIPRERFNTEVREQIQGILKRALKGERVDYNVQVGDSVLARVHVIVRPRLGQEVTVDVRDIEKKLERAVRSWSDELQEALVRRLGEERGVKLANRYGRAFPAAYTEDVSGWVASFDVEKLDMLEGPDDLQMSLYRPRKQRASDLRFKIFRYNTTIQLSVALPILENMGLRIVSERPYEVRMTDGRRLWIQDFDMTTEVTEELRLDKVRENFQRAFAGIFRGEIENDGFNRLILAARLKASQVCMLRAYCKYLLQTGVPFSQAYMEETLAAHPEIVELLVALFESRFRPGRNDDRDKQQAYCVRELDTALEHVNSLDEDRILRAFMSVILATVRTNHYRAISHGDGDPYTAFKFDSRRITELPKPKPMYEVFVCSPRVEGIHLRGGKVARGGLRWSDRREDFRTEVLGLMKAQTVKNTMIVPVGSKGGFVCKRLPPGGGREEIQAEVVHCYRTFINGLLDLTDNLRGGRVVHPDKVVRHDDDDTYLVVAADKGTATFSDLANEVAGEHDFWLGDAFASGGSHGYDHKKMGITARGGWESVKRHFRELGKDIQSEPFTVVGIGDMGGDVFGNGMLLSRQIKLQAAFNHMHIFLDPDPDPETSFQERQRLFDLPRSTWADYDQNLVSRGGGIFDRSAKQVTLSPEVREMLGIEVTSLTPNELIRELLKAPVELLWNGGIGTYVKAEGESNLEVGDRANDAVRVDGRDLRCNVVGEGGNLGLTQRGRIEYALNGGRINTDFIDNSGGVDCSDHEVNIKILFNEILAAGKLDMDRRNELLEEMTDEVADLVLRNNYLQTQALSMLEAQSIQRLGEFAHFIRVLERRGTLDRDLEFLPDAEKIRERRALGQGLSRPELSVLLSYSKISIYSDLLDSDVPEDPFLSRELVRYFPKPLQEKYADFIEKHRLRREIIATAVTNSMVNRMGAAFALRLREDTGATPAEVAKAYTIAREVFNARELWRLIETLDIRVDAAIQTEMILQVWRLLRHATRWMLTRHKHDLAISESVETYQPGIERLSRLLDQVVGESDRETFTTVPDQLKENGVPEELATRIGALPALNPGLDIVEVANAKDLPVELVARVYFQLGEKLQLRWLRTQIEALPVDGQWHAQARGALRGELYRRHRQLTAAVLDNGEDEAGGKAVYQWMKKHQHQVNHVKRMFADMRTLDVLDFATISVAIRSLEQLVRETAG
jgi:glutamate dehydrogenase